MIYRKLSEQNARLAPGNGQRLEAMGRLGKGVAGHDSELISGNKKPPGSDLFSHAVTNAVSSALRRFTSVFGMETGGSASLKPPKDLIDMLMASWRRDCYSPGHRQQNYSQAVDVVSTDFQMSDASYTQSDRPHEAIKREALAFIAGRMSPRSRFSV